jgi:hypothetical protein
MPAQQRDSSAPEYDAAEGHANGARRTFPPCRDTRVLRSLPGCPLGCGLRAFSPLTRPGVHHSLLSWPGTLVASDLPKPGNYQQQMPRLAIFAGDNQSVAATDTIVFFLWGECKTVHEGRCDIAS